MSLPSSFIWCRERMDGTTTDLLGLDQASAQVVQPESEVVDRRDTRACLAQSPAPREPRDESFEPEHRSLDPGVQLLPRALEPIRLRTGSREPGDDTGLIGDPPKRRDACLSLDRDRGAALRDGLRSRGAAKLLDGHERAPCTLEPQRFGRAELGCWQRAPVGTPWQIERQLQQVHEQAGAQRERQGSTEEDVRKGDREAEHETRAIDAKWCSHQKFEMTSLKTVSIDAGSDAS